MNKRTKDSYTLDEYAAHVIHLEIELEDLTKQVKHWREHAEELMHLNKWLQKQIGGDD